MNIKENSTELKRRVMVCRSKLQHIGVIGAKQGFCLKFPQYKSNNESLRRLDNLWYCKVSDEQFVKELESFVVFKEVEFL